MDCKGSSIWASRNRKNHVISHFFLLEMSLVWTYKSCIQFAVKFFWPNIKKIVIFSVFHGFFHRFFLDFFHESQKQAYFEVKYVFVSALYEREPESWENFLFSHFLKILKLCMVGIHAKFVGLISVWVLLKRSNQSLFHSMQ